ncbi:hypothetical protein K505DRAFT_252185 [Melanomma pulvis-pyrius CBS 109.77]|uniref:Secreted protein n=1 Tax=Melanomma pulvis-pyrius CBS 109.77 TaxID=1314802 RepID=A0A6A6X1A1_9PLEO|nr:hypothetical protein K505DRAFT_252185 [Melanomma pulvis-pyrius CBS 109.77]
MFGLLPLSLRVTFLRLGLAAAFIICRPTTVELVKATLSTSICEEMAAPGTFPKPEIMFITPGGKPASLTRPAAIRAPRGVCSGDLRTIVFPAAIAGPIFHDHMTSTHQSNKSYLGLFLYNNENVPAPSWCS